MRLNIALKKDPHAGKNGYMIRSLYFDDYWMSAYQEKSMGVLDRKKYRIRIYNYSDATIKLERKRRLICTSTRKMPDLADKSLI